MNTQEIIQKLWNLCNVLRDDGITYHEYVTELTYILFLKMAKETGAEAHIPKAYRWDMLVGKSGLELKKYYQNLLMELGEHSQGRIREIYEGAQTKIDEPKNLEKSLKPLMSWTGSPLKKKDWETSMKAFWKRTPTKRNPAPDSTSRLGCSST